MTGNQTLPTPEAGRKPNTTPSRPVTELLLEIAYHLHATTVVARPAVRSSRPRTSTPRSI